MINGYYIEETGKVLIQWGLMILGLGAAVVTIGIVLLIIGRVFFPHVTYGALTYLENCLK